MKSISIFFAMIVIVVFMSCSSTKSISTVITYPPVVSLPKEAQSIGILNRSIASEKQKGLDKIDKILSLEGKNLDKEGAQRAIGALQNELSRNANFSEVKLIEATASEQSGGSVFPASLPWERVEALCETHGVKALFVLSIYDTDATATYETTPTEIKGPLGITIPALEHTVNITTQIKTGWRIYDPIHKIIRDEQVINKNTVSSGKGINPVKAIEAAKHRKEAVLALSHTIGQNYAGRTFPSRRKIYRDYYTKGTQNFEIAQRNVQTNQWDNAAALWQKEVNNLDPEIAGRACFNMALYHEITGDHNKALEWAKKSYTDYENKKALGYVNDLKRRITIQRQLQ